MLINNLLYDKQMRADKSQWTTKMTLYFNFILLLVRWFIIVGASLSEQCIADLMSWHTSQQNLSPSAVPWAGFLHTNACTTELPEDVRFSWNITFTHLKFMVYGRKQTDIHTTSAHAVTLVWGSLRLAPIIIIDLYFLFFRCSPFVAWFRQ